MKKLRVFLVDDEPLAVRRLARMLEETGKIEITGQTSEPLEALKIIPTLSLDALFLDIQMPGLSGFELLKKLEKYPPVIFTTAYDEFALDAFEVYSIDYLLKPIESERLEKALEKLGKFTSESLIKTAAKLERFLGELSDENKNDSADFTRRIASRIGAKVQILNVADITHFFAQDKITFAKDIEGREFPLDDSLNKLEEKLDPGKFLRVHRASIINLDRIEEVHGWFSGRVLIRMKDKERTEVVVARDRVKKLRKIIGL
ncbi:MAG: LytTR family DNA-binding domain-containing protein [Pyrinomonadaceae bacterium]